MSDITCTCLNVYVRDRLTGAEVEGCDLSNENITDGYWTRTLSTTSDAYVKSDLADFGCCECSPQIWEHELVVERETDGGDAEEIWSGIITRTIEDRVFGTFEIFAFDRSILWSRQPYALSDLFFPAGTDEGVVWSRLVAEAEGCVQSGLNVQSLETGCPIVEDLFIAEGETWFDKLAELASVQWAVVANQMIGPAVNLQGENVQHRLATDIDWADSGAVVDTDGETTATHVTVCSGEPGDGARICASYPTATPQPSVGVGCHTLRVVDPKITNAAQALDAARTIYEQRRNGNRALVTSSGTLSKDTELCIADLVPDRRVSVETSGTCDDFVEVKKMQRILGSFVRSSEGGRTCLRENRVAVDFIPVGGVASASRLSV